MEKNEVIEALYLILGQDYKGGGWNVERNRRFGIQSHSWKNHRAYVADDYDDETYQDDEQWEHGHHEEDDSWLEEGSTYEAYDDEGQDFDYMMQGTMVKKNPGLTTKKQTVPLKWLLPMIPLLPPTRMLEDDSKS